MLPVLLKTRLGLPLASRWGFDAFAELDRFADAVFRGQTSAGLSVDIREDQDKFYIDADVPGFSRSDIEVTCEDGLLTISGHRASSECREGESFRCACRTASKRMPSRLNSRTVS